MDPTSCSWSRRRARSPRSEASLERARTALADHALQFDDSERLPVTVSVGVCTFPDHGESVTDLLTTAALTLQEAKASGGDAIRFAGQQAEPEPQTRTFDVYQGLIFAVDTKDRYTKRHSEDVARYGVFLAEQMGARPESIQTIRRRRPAARRRQDRHPGPHPAQARQAHRGGVRDRPAARRARRPDRPRPARRRARSAPAIRHHHERWDGTRLSRPAGRRRTSRSSRASWRSPTPSRR